MGASNRRLLLTPLPQSKAPHLLFPPSTIPARKRFGQRSNPALFTHEQVLRQLKQYGEPQITQEPSRYAIAGHTAAITVASVAIPAAPGKIAQVIYAAKTCALGNIPVKSRRRSDSAEPVTHVVCFDFTTQNGGMLAQMFPSSFSLTMPSLSPCSRAA
jgi:hypothetical protein